MDYVVLAFSGLVIFISGMVIGGIVERHDRREQDEANAETYRATREQLRKYADSLRTN